MKIINIPFYLKQILYMFPMFVGYILSFAKGKNMKAHGVWLLMERGFDAQDNAWHLMKFLQKEYPDINAFFAIIKNAKDKSNLLFCKESVLNYGSIRYYMYLYKADKIISTHLGTFFPSLWLTGKLKKTFLYPKAKKVFLQHGITHNDIPHLHYSFNRDLKLFITGARNEYDLVHSNYNYPPNIVQYCGLARFDNLYDFETKQTILIMPTWRMQYKYYSDDAFMSTDFYQAYKYILTNKILKVFLSKTGYKLKFINHVEFQKFNHLFEIFNDSCVEILSLTKCIYQDLLKDADVLITDYSSVYYDFVYMQKPVVFYHMNKEMFYKGQYGNDFDDVSEFGLVALSEQEVINAIISLINQKCLMDEKYVSNMKQIFPLHDKNNCKRITEAILKI